MKAFMIGVAALALLLGAAPPSTLPASAPVGATAPPVTLEGFIEGGITAFAVQGRYVYIGSGPRLSILKNADTGQGERVASLTVAGLITDIAVAGRYAYVTDSREGLHIIDVADPAQPTEVRAFALPYGAKRLALGERDSAGQLYAYIIGNDSVLRIVEVTNPTAPVLVSAYPIAYSRAITIVGSYAYVVNGDLNNGGLHVIDVANPLAPTPVGLYQAANFGHLEVKVQGRFAYLSAFQTMGGYTIACMKVLDLAQPANPVLVNTFYPSANGFYLSDRVTLAVLPDYAAIGTTDRLFVVNIADPAAPRTIGTLGLSAPAGHLVASGNLFYLSDQVYGLHRVTIAQPAAPTLVNLYTTAADGPVAASDEYVYVAPRGVNVNYSDGVGAAIHTISSVQPAQPAIVSTDIVPGVRNITIAGERLYAIWAKCSYSKMPICNAGLRIQPIISAPNKPAVDGYTFPFPRPSEYPEAVAVAGARAFVGQGSRLHALDVANPTVRLTGTYTLSGTITDVAAQTGPAGEIYAYAIAGNPSGLHLFDATAPVTPTQVGVYAPAGRLVKKVAVAADAPPGPIRYVYLVTTTYGGEAGWLEVVDVTNPAAPERVGSAEAPGEPIHAIALSHRYAYVVAGSNLYIFDVIDPATPVAAGHVPLASSSPNASAHVATANSRVYVATDGDLLIFRHGYTISGRIADRHSTPFHAATLTASDGQIVAPDARGVYAVNNLPPGAYTLTPALPGYALWPPSLTTAVPGDASGQNFTVLAAPVTTPLSPGVATTLTVTDTQGLPTSLNFPPGAVSQATTVTLTPTLASGPLGRAFVGHAFELTAGPATTDWSAPVTATITYSPADVRVITDTAALTLAWWDGAAWVDAAITCTAAEVRRDLAGHTISVPLCKTGRYALFGPAYQVALPVFRR